MLELDIRIDTDLREKAIEITRTFTNSNQHPIHRTQIARLMQIAANEPNSLIEFARDQESRAEARLKKQVKDGPKRNRLLSEVEFWKMIGCIIDGKTPKSPWSLAQECENDLPADLKNLVKPHPTDTSGREVYNRRTTERKRREQQWNRDHYPGFFRHFCAEYLYRMPLEQGNHHESD